MKTIDLGSVPAEVLVKFVQLSVDNDRLSSELEECQEVLAGDRRAFDDMHRLADAKQARIESLEREVGRLQKENQDLRIAAPYHQAACSPIPVDKAMIDSIIREHLAHNPTSNPEMKHNKINAIKMFRVLFGLGLKEAKDLVEEAWSRRAPAPAPSLAMPSARVVLD